MTLADQIQLAMRPRDDWWLPGVAAGLSRDFSYELESSGLCSTGYGSERYLATRGLMPEPAEEAPGCFVQYMSPALMRYYDAAGLDAASVQDLPLEAATSRVETALALIGRVPSLLASVRHLVLAIHPLRSPSLEIDVGYSDPALPFSIFVSIPGSNDPVCRLRLAESIVHEAMHLQLSLIERLVPLIATEQIRRHSPWRDEGRPTGGILHGVYVFAVIRDLMTQLLDLRALDPSSKGHAKRRIRQIREELAEVSWLPTSTDLTHAGRTFSKALLSNIRAGEPMLSLN